MAGGPQQRSGAWGRGGPWGVARAGVAALTRSRAEAWSGGGVCCNAVGPSFVRTTMTEPLFADQARVEALAARTMIGRNGAVDDYRGIAVFLASHASDFVTGQTIFVDGGFSSS